MEEEEEPIKKTIDGIKEIKQMLQLLIKKKGIRLEFEKGDKQPMQTVSTLQLGMWATTSQQDSVSVKTIEGSSNERTEPTRGRSLVSKTKTRKPLRPRW